jgi:phosphoglycolate phosphatase
VLIFDLDGTLIDSRRDIAIACNHALETLGHAPRPEDEIGGFVGDGARKLIARALGSTDDALVERGLEVFLAYYLAHPVEHTLPMPGAIDALDALAHTPMTVATNKRREVAIAVLRELGLLPRFAHVWGGGDGKPKPDPACVHALAERSSCALSDVWIVGDGSQDIGAGKAAGVRTVAVLGGFHDESKLRALAPDFVIRDLRELAPIVTAEAARLRFP